ncbi:MAG: Slp family lipoprotein [Candidatus Omnitrophica bacterium]|nr:Slp family lipoprotein [Candidatus Omnitrophota bacterium]
MKKHVGIQVLMAGVILPIISGCMSYPISKAVRKEAKDITLSQVIVNPKAYQGTVVIWGGRIIKTVNETNGGAIYALETPLNRYEQPVPRRGSKGRFIARSSGFLDPQLYRPGRLITVAGRISGVKVEPIDKVEYGYPKLQILEITLWSQRVIPYYYYYPPPGWDWDWDMGWDGDWGWGYGWGWPYPYWHYHLRWYHRYDLD